MNARFLLEIMQESANMVHNPEANKESHDLDFFYRYVYNEEKKSWELEILPKRLLPKLPTKYQDLGEYLLLYICFNSLFSIMNTQVVLDNYPNIKSDYKDKVIYGTVNNTEFNSSVQHIGNEYLIIFNSELLTIIGEMSTIVTYLLFVDDEISYNSLKTNLTEKTNIIKEFIEKIYAYDLFSHTWWNQQHKIEPSELFWKIRDQVRNETLSFICAHELGHIICNHLNKKNSTKEDNIWEQEYQADRFAADIMLQERGVNPVFTSIGLALATSIFECLDRLHGNIIGKSTSQHPYSFIRRNRVGGMVKNYGKDIGAFLLTIYLIEYLWDEFMEFGFFLLKNGIKISPENFTIIQKVLYNEYTLSMRTIDDIMEEYEGGKPRIVRAWGNWDILEEL